MKQSTSIIISIIAATIAMHTTSYIVMGICLAICVYCIYNEKTK